jgi:hypothetical protein
MRDYNRFLNSILENPLLRSSEIVEEFITKSQNDFHTIKLKYKKLEKKVMMKDFLSLTGELDATFYQDKYNLSLNIPKIIEKKRNLYLNLNNSLKEVINELEIIDSKMNNLSEAFHNLSIEYKNNFEKNELFENFGNFCKNLSNIYSQEKKFFQIDIKEFFKYLRLELEEVDKLFNECKYAKINFERAESNLILFEKNKIINNEEIYKIELKKKQIEKLNSKRICCFLQNRACDEYERVKQTHENRINKAFKNENSNILEVFKKEYDNLLKLINNF